MYSVVIYSVLTNTRIRIPAMSREEAMEICLLHAPYAHVERWG